VKQTRILVVIVYIHVISAVFMWIKCLS